MKLSIITVAYRKWEIVIDLLKSIEVYNDLEDEIEVIVVDNSPQEEKIKDKISGDWKFKLVYLENENNGFGAGNNKGAQIARGKYLAFINPDIVLVEPLFKDIINVFEENEKIATIGVKLLSPDFSWALSFFYGYKINIIKRLFLKFYNEQGIFNKKEMYTSGADLFISKELFFKAGCFDENIFMYYEEIDLASRIERICENTERYYLNGKKLIHREGKCSEEKRKYLEMEFASCKYVAEKYNYDYRKKIKTEYCYLIITCFIKKLSRNIPVPTDALAAYRKYILEFQRTSI